MDESLNDPLSGGYALTVSDMDINPIFEYIYIIGGITGNTSSPAEYPVTVQVFDPWTHSIHTSQFKLNERKSLFYACFKLTSMRGVSTSTWSRQVIVAGILKSVYLQTFLLWLDIEFLFTNLGS